MPAAGTASNLDEALLVAGKIGYPLMVRPSYVLGGRGMEVVHDDEELKCYVAAAVGVTPGLSRESFVGITPTSGIKEYSQDNHFLSD